MAVSTSAVVDQEENIKLLVALHDKFDLFDFAGPLEAFNQSFHDIKDKETKAFDITIAGAEPFALSGQDVGIASQISFKEAHERLDEFDVLMVVGGNTTAVLKANSEPLPLLKRYADLQKASPDRERTLLSICTGSLFLAQQGLLVGLSGTTHPDYMTAFENLCSHSAVITGDERTDVIDDARYVVNNLRFDLGDEDDNPYIRRQSDGRRPSNARKGSISLKGSNSRRESITRRAAMRLGGLRVITSGGISSGVDAALYLIDAVVSEEAALEAARLLQWTWQKGVVINGLDV